MSRDCGTLPDDDPVTVKFHAALSRLAGDRPRLGIALSGGGDSTALMHLAHGWARGHAGREVMAATVDHGLRPESAAEAVQAHQAAARLGIAHDTLLWQRGDADGGNLMAAGREARLRLMADWARRNRLDAVLLGHTLDDQAETVLMRLARGAGVDGLAGMAEAREAFGMCWLRPMLAISRDDLRDWMRARAIGWIDDPTNENPDYERVRVRQALRALDLPARQLAQSAANMAMARDALRKFADEAAQGAEAAQGSLRLPWPAFHRAPAEIRRRLLVAGLRFVSGAVYPARREAVLHVLSGLERGERMTLDGVIVTPQADWLSLVREPAAAQRSGAVCADGADAPLQWDGRWTLSGLRAGQCVAALGYEPLAGLNWRASGLGRDEAAATPAIWQGDRLIAAPLLESVPEIRVRALRGLREFRALLYTH